MAKLQVGMMAPDFELRNQDGVPVRLSSYRSKKHVVLYFYPKNETAGCTIEACGFRDTYEEFANADTEVIGVSNDSVESHKLFRENRRLPFQLLSDADDSVRKLYGISGSFMGLIPGRETLVIDKSGVIRLKIATQFPNPHIRRSLQMIKELK